MDSFLHDPSSALGRSRGTFTCGPRNHFSDMKTAMATNAVKMAGRISQSFELTSALCDDCLWIWLVGACFFCCDNDNYINDYSAVTVLLQTFPPFIAHNAPLISFSDSLGVWPINCGRISIITAHCFLKQACTLAPPGQIFARANFSRDRSQERRPSCWILSEEDLLRLTFYTTNNLRFTVWFSPGKIARKSRDIQVTFMHNTFIMWRNTTFLHTLLHFLSSHYFNTRRIMCRLEKSYIENSMISWISLTLWH